MYRHVDKETYLTVCRNLQMNDKTKKIVKEEKVKVKLR
jgi:hypothetical protein